ncbi:hypothetical protein [methanotrophic endosymbiont of Bathymodiolus puteoserpentis (Logatchev)]|jgi:hypothetical protein|uniref:hypothetical protein n=1 Tax=methanotrophic endosymbiont of Bathymodiolus puteoserpentis (Logatchev) TaxID=343235 RepID=UPI0013CD39B0|nr:hypothetical protein [methanotrophic endosymbiont of Bathymodiolus puteoserpentis (Logatchev)]SHE19257.1 hypothetical protein BPUTEOMOX_184 [methanotrophic endosymbiont of Bathymodiolus puteoserpentis (Logatchev)]
MLLTATQSSATLCSKSVTQVTEILMLSMGRFEPRKNNGVGDYTLCRSLFLCPKSLLSTLKNPTLWWERLLEQLRYAAVQANMNSHRPKIEPFSGGLSLNNGASQMHNHTQKPLTIHVSPIKDPETLDNIINEIFRTVGTCQFAEKNALEYGELSRVEIESLKRDAEYLINACNKALRTPHPPKDTLTSRFNVLAKDTRQLIAKQVSFNQAKQYPDAIVKFSCMVGGAA